MLLFYFKVHHSKSTMKFFLIAAVLVVLAFANGMSTFLKLFFCTLKCIYLVVKDNVLLTPQILFIECLY